MDKKVVKKSYQSHSYSGKKNLKAVRAQLKRHHGEGVSREDVWRKKPKKDPAQDPPNKPKTYSRVPKFHVEAEFSKTQAIGDNSKPGPSKTLDLNWPVDPNIQSHQLTIEADKSDPMDGLSGYRIINIAHVLNWAFKLGKHMSTCDGSLIKFVKESQNGFQSTFTFKCTMCNKEFVKSNEEEEKINKSFVWGTVTAGSYYTQVAHVTNIMDIPTMSPNLFRKTEKLLGEVWMEHLTVQIKEIGAQERAIAIQKGHVNSDGVPYKTVVVDGSWAKRSYGHDYNSASGMACIIGKETKKCLYLGVKNKYCYHCQIYEKDKKTPPKHLCFKNFEGASTSMESTILVEGFNQSESMHGVQFLFLIGDGDSSVFAQIRENVSYGQKIQKIECKNHVMKNYTSALYKILANTKLPLLGRRMLKQRLPKLTAVSRKIIVHNSNNRSVMREHLQNGPLHVFGRHTNCQEYYCKFKATGEHDIDNVDEMKNKATAVWALICAANENVMSKTSRLSNDTTNIAENFMSIVSKFNCGKRLNLHKGGSYQRRVCIAGLSQVHGQSWHLPAWRKMMHSTPGTTFKKYIARQEKSKSRKKLVVRRRLFVAKPAAKPDQHYGPQAQQFVDTVEDEELKKMCDQKIAEFQKTQAEIKAIEEATIGQHENELYILHRADRLTASQFGLICKRRKSTPCHNHVKQVLYKNNIQTSDMVYGQQNESVARTIFAENYKKNVRQAGFFIDEEYGFLGASPDGLVLNENALLEIKCFPSLARKDKDIRAAAQENKDFPIKLTSDGALVMNKKHSYYYQVQGQLRVTKMEKAYFICYVSPSLPITVLEIERDELFIENMMPKLVNFYKNSVLPEIVLRRVSKGAKCLDLHLYD